MNNKKLALAARISGHISADHIVNPETGEILVAAGELIKREAAEELGVEYIYLYDIYDRVGTDYEGNEISGEGYTVDGTHPNIYGRELIARTIADYLNRE